MPKIISEEMRYPTAASTKKKRWVTFVCDNCGVTTGKWYQKSTWNGKCEHCSKGGFTIKEFLTKAKEIHGETYDYSKTVYKNKRTPLKIICREHGEFLQRPAEHFEGHGCNLCGNISIGKKQLLDKSVWVERIKKYPLIDFKDENQIHSYHKYVDLICSIHGDFNVSLGSIGQNIHLCPECSRVSHQTQSVRQNLIGQQTTLYYVYLPAIDMYKLGVTTQPLKQRFNSMEHTILLEESIEYTQALKIEHDLHAELKDFRYQGTKKLISDGSTELYKTDIFYYLKRALYE